VLAPGELRAVELGADATAKSSGEIKLGLDGDQGHSVAWSYSRSSGDRVVEASYQVSLAQANPFFPLLLIHDLAKAGAGGRADVRVKASQPARVEIIHAGDLGLIAVDSEGDGSFMGIGDVTGRDEDGNGWPDLPTPGSLWLRIIPQAVVVGAPPLDVVLEIKRGREWKTLGHHRLLMPRASP
jgi:hypothetical protein